MAIPVKLQVFEGPLDLLLHLITINKIDIYDIPIVEITDQYLEYIRGMDMEDMNVASEFLVMAATLIDIKCRMLLPKETDENGEEEDPREELVEKLLEYKMYKTMSYALKDRAGEAALQVFRRKNLPREVADYEPPINYEELVGDNTLATLNALFQEVLRRKKDRVDPVRSTFGRIEKEEVNIGARTLHIRDVLRSRRTTDFTALLENTESRAEVIVTFLVILEMMKTGEVTLRQEKLFGTILMEYHEEAAAEFDFSDIEGE